MWGNLVDITFYGKPLGNSRIGDAYLNCRVIYFLVLHLRSADNAPQVISAALFIKALTYLFKKVKTNKYCEKSDSQLVIFRHSYLVLFSY